MRESSVVLPDPDFLINIINNCLGEASTRTVNALEVPSFALSYFPIDVIENLSPKQ